MLHRRSAPVLVLAIVLTGCGSGGESGSSAFTDTIPPSTGVVQDGLVGDIDTQSSITALHANWHGFSDDSGQIAEYRWAIGTTPGGTQVQPWTSVGTAQTASNNSLVLGVGSTYYVAVRAYDPSGNESQVASSDGCLIESGSGGGGGQPPPGTHATSITQWGVTWTFASPVSVGQFCNGDWWAVGPVDIVSISPPTQVVGGRTINGSMVNPTTVAGGEHGYDSMLFHPYENGRYKSYLNVATGVSPASPLTLQAGSSLISAISYLGTSPPPSGSMSQLSTAAVLTVLGTAPAADAFRPAYAGTDKTIRHREADLDYSSLGSLTPTAGAQPVATLAARFQRVWLDHCSGWTSRFLHPIDNMPDYGRDFTSLYGTGCLMLQTNLPDSQKRDLLVRLTQIGIDFFGNMQAGGTWTGTGGQGSGRKFPILLAGAVLNDAAMLSIGTTHPSGYFGAGHPNNQSHFGEDCQTFYVQQTSPGTYNWGFGNYNSAHNNLPEWGNSHTEYPSNDNSVWLADPYRRCCTANAWVGQTLAARVMGLRTAWNHPSYFDYMDRFMQTEPVGEWTRCWDTWQATMWDQHRASL